MMSVCAYVCHNLSPQVVNGTFSLQKQWLTQNSLPWNEEAEQELVSDIVTEIV